MLLEDDNKEYGERGLCDERRGRKGEKEYGLRRKRGGIRNQQGER